MSSPCEGAQTDGTVDIGGTTYTVYQFASGDAADDLIQLVDFTDVGAGDTVTLPVLNTGLEIGVFSCGDHPLDTPVTEVEDSGGSPLPVEPPCTLDGDATSVTQGTNVEQFTNDGSGSIDNLVLYTLNGNLNTASVAAPEPGSLDLLGFGLIAVALFARRRRQSQVSDAS
ncbi:MAG: PEP-CTERM sorting domain-containing protein [Candidatus Acidiferrales bacterium]